MANYTTWWFDRRPKKNEVDTHMLCRSVRKMRVGLVDADLGSSLVKKRLARLAGGKSGGYRTLVATSKSDRTLLVFGFPKSVRSNMDRDKEEALKTLVSHLLGPSSGEVLTAMAANGLNGVFRDA